MKKKQTTRSQDAAYMLNALAQVATRKVGDKVFGKGGVVTTVTAIEGSVATLATGEQCHVSRLRNA